MKEIPKEYTTDKHVEFDPLTCISTSSRPGPGDWPNPESTAGNVAVMQPNVPGQGYFPGSYEYKYSHPKWFNVMHGTYHNAEQIKAASERNRLSSNFFTSKVVEKTDKNQADSSQKLRERFQDLTYWKMELQRTLEDMTAELELLGAMKTRMEKSLRTSEIPMQINLDCMHNRDRRQMPDRVNDQVDEAMYKEMVLIRSVQELMRKMIKEANEQMRRLRDIKELCEFDWGDKWEACNIESINSKLNNNSKSAILRHGAAIPMPNASTLEEWMDTSRSNIQAAETERAAATRLRAVMDGVLADTCRDMRDQGDAVDMALSDRVGEMEEALQRLEHNRDRILNEITQTERMNCELQRTYEQMEQPLKVNQSRLDYRKYRSGVELSKDIPHHRLLDENADLMASMDAIMLKIGGGRDMLDRLEETRMDLERDISIKHKSLFIDRQKCRPVRAKYPSFSVMLGYD